MILTTAELIHINNAAKALKARRVLIMYNVVISLDNINSILSYTYMDPKFISNYVNGIIIDQRPLSAFVNKISTESEFDFQFGIPQVTKKDNIEFTIDYPDYKYISIVYNRFKAISSAYTNPIIEREMPELRDIINSLSKESGNVNYLIDNYYITLFAPIVPVNKADKLTVSIYDNMIGNTFVCKFSVDKKKFVTTTFVKYLKVNTEAMG